MLKKTSLLAAGLLAASTGIAAAQVSVRAEAGAAFTSSLSLASSSTTGKFNDNVTSALTGIGVSYHYMPWLRTEISISALYPAEFGATSGADNLRVSGKISALRGFVSAFIQPIEAFAPGALGPVKPYLGGGVGFARVDFKSIHVDDQLLPNPVYDVDSKTRTNFAWHLSGGVSVDLDKNFSVDVGYRYVDQGRIRSGSTLSSPTVSLPIDAFRDRLQTHEVVVGVAYKF